MMPAQTINRKRKLPSSAPWWISNRVLANPPRSTMFVTILVSWIASVIWFHPRLVLLLDMATGLGSWMSLAFFIVFVEVAWLYGFYNIWVVLFAKWYHWQEENPPTASPVQMTPLPSVAILYTTYNDFIEASALSCVAQDYASYTVYILDDSTLPSYQQRVDAFAATYPDRVQVVRRVDRAGFKAGNLNHALENFALEPLFALVDADEILPTDFLSSLAPRLWADPSCGFIQASHRSNPETDSSLAQAMGVGVDIHWRWYQPLRNRYGFVMLLGHGAILRRQCWEDIGGFPELVSEDLAYALRIRERGWRGTFAQDVICYEDFPETVRAFRVRFMKWTRGTCEFLMSETPRLLRAKEISWTEKMDILMPTLNLPLSFVYFLFMINANIFLPYLFGVPRPVAVELGAYDVALPTLGLDPGFSAIMSLDFYLITLLTLLSPVLCFVVELITRPAYLFQFLCKSAAVYATLAPLACLGVLSYLVTRRATFLVTGDSSRYADPTGKAEGRQLVHRVSSWFRQIIHVTHPDHPMVQGFEILCGVILAAACLMLVQVSFLGLALGFILMPVLHHFRWDNRIIQRLVYVPFGLILSGIFISAMGVIGLQPLFFGFGFHF